MVPREMPHDKGRKCAMKWRKFYPNEKRNVPVCEINEDETTLIVDFFNFFDLMDIYCRKDKHSRELPDGKL